MPSVHSHTLDLCVTKLYLTKLLILQRGFMNDSFAVAAGAWLLRSQNLLICLCAVVSRTAHFMSDRRFSALYALLRFLYYYPATLIGLERNLCAAWLNFGP